VLHELDAQVKGLPIEEQLLVELDSRSPTAPTRFCSELIGVVNAVDWLSSPPEG